MTERLIIDLAACDRCATPCHHPAVLAIRERATFELVCRRCQVASCVLACPFQALERTADGIIKRHNLRCVSCKSCALACPFGTIYAELLPFYALDYAAAVGVLVGGASAATSDVVEEKPRSPLTRLLHKECKALQYGEVDPGDSGIHIIDEHLAARVRRWVRKEVAA
jgi:Fe-S-cluster-containing hydrogenase component 2